MESILDFLNQHLEKVLIVALLGTGLFLTLRLGFIQFRRFFHGIAVVSGKYDDPNAPGDVTHFQALTTALSATVGIGNIAGVAIAIHWGGPGAVFWMWVTALLGMATKFSEVTLAQHFRVSVKDKDGNSSISGGPMYYIEKGLGKKWKPVAIFFAFALILMAMISGNAIQANTLADLVETIFGVPSFVTGLLSTAVVGMVIIGGIGRIGKVTSILAPSMAALYVGAGLIAILLNHEAIIPSVNMIFSEAFNPTAGIAGTGTGAFLQTLMWGVRRGLFSNEAGQGSAPIAHSAAKTDEPVSEGVVALLEPFIDTIVICSITAMVILTTGVWKQTTVTDIQLSASDISYVQKTETTFAPTTAPEFILVDKGIQTSDVQLAWHEVSVEKLFIDPDMTIPFTGKLNPALRIALDENSKSYPILYGKAVENSAPLTMLAYENALGKFGMVVVLLCVILFAISTAISWSYYGDRCAIYLFGQKSIFTYRLLYVIMHFVGAILSLNVIWKLGDLAMALGTIPNVVALIMLSGLVRKLANEYFGKEKI